MAGPSLWVKLSGKHVDPRAAQQFREQDFPQPEPCTVVQEPPFFSPDAKLSVAESFKGATVLITGAVGFVGSVVLEQLLRLCPEITRIYLVVRPKRNRTAEERVASLLRRPLFRELYVDGQISPDISKKILTLAGDLLEAQLGLTTADMKKLRQEVTHIIHSAASISFIDPVMSLLNQNYEATKRVAEIACKMQHLKVFCHVSTAYVNSFKSQYEHVEERIYPLYLADGKLVDHIQIAAQLHSVDPEAAEKKALDVCKETGLLNTYTLTKYMTEQLISEYHNQKFPVCIVRPSLVGSIAYHPTPGYFGNSAGSTAYLLAYGMGIATYTAHRPESIYDLIPADLVGAIIVGTTAATAQGLVSSGKDPVVVHACASTTNPIRHIRMFDDIVTPFWTEHPAKYRFSYGYPKSTDFLSYVKEGSALFWLLTLYHNVKFALFALLLRIFGLPDLATKLWEGWQAWCTYNTEKLDLQLFFCSRNARHLESIIVPEESSAMKMVWRPKDDWVDYLFTHQHYIKRFFFNQPKKVS